MCGFYIDEKYNPMREIFKQKEKEKEIPPLKTHQPLARHHNIESIYQSCSHCISGIPKGIIDVHRLRSKTGPLD